MLLVVENEKTDTVGHAKRKIPHLNRYCIRAILILHLIFLHQTLLQIATHNGYGASVGHAQCVTTLIRAGANVNIRDVRNGDRLTEFV